MLVSALRDFVGSFSPPPPALAAPATTAQGIEARTSLRHEAAIDARLCLAGTEHCCVIRNISIGGMTVASDTAAVCIGQQVVIESQQMGTLYGIVRWFRDGCFGVQFPVPVSLDIVKHARESVPEGMRPRAGRARMKLAAVAHYGSFHRQVEVANISVQGLMMVTRMPLRPAQSVMVEFPEMLPIGGHIRWSAEGRCGMMFTKLLQVSAAAELAHRARLGEAWLAEVRTAHAQANA